MHVGATKHNGPLCRAVAYTRIVVVVVTCSVVFAETAAVMALLFVHWLALYTPAFISAAYNLRA